MIKNSRWSKEQKHYFCVGFLAIEKQHGASYFSMLDNHVANTFELLVLLLSAGEFLVFTVSVLLKIQEEYFLAEGLPMTRRSWQITSQLSDSFTAGTEGGK